MYGQGISREGGLLDIGLNLGIINKSGAWLSYGEERLGQGRDNSKEFLKAHLETASEIDTKIRSMIQANQVPVAKTSISAGESFPED